MGFKKQKESNLGIIGNYWRISQVNTNYIRNDCHVIIELYASETAYITGKNPLPESVSITLTQEDHPIDITETKKKTIYTHIRQIAQVSQGKNDRDRTQSEWAALFFADAENLL